MRSSLEESLVIRGSGPRQVGRNAAVASGARAVMLTRALGRAARRNPALMSLASASPADDCTRAEIDGAADVLGMHPEDLSAARNIMCSISHSGCTNFGASGPATADGSVMLSWNFDVPSFFRLLMGSFPMFVRELPGKIPYLCMGIPVLFGIGIMNAEGVASVVNAVGVTDDGEGFSPFELNNMAMETCSSVEQARAVFETGPRWAMKAMTMGVLMNWNTIWSDKDGSLSVFESSHNHFKEQKAGPEGYIASANHHQFLDQALSGGRNPQSQPIISGSYSRLARMYRLLDEYHGRLGPKEAKLMISDHIPDYSTLEPYGIEREWWEEKVDDSTICAHAWNMKKHLSHGRFYDASLEASFSTTVYSFQIQPGSMTTWFTDGHPCRNTTTPIYWGRLMGADAERQPGAREPAEAFRERKQSSRPLMFSRDATGILKALADVWMTIMRYGEKRNFR